MKTLPSMTIDWEEKYKCYKTEIALLFIKGKKKNI